MSWEVFQCQYRVSGGAGMTMAMDMMDMTYHESVNEKKSRHSKKFGISCLLRRTRYSF